MRIGIAADHAGFALKKELATALSKCGHEVVDFGPSSLNPKDDYPDYVVPLARSVASSEVERGMAICGSGVGACVTANKVKGVRAALVHDVFSAHQGVEDDNMNVICFGARVLGSALAWDLTEAFLAAHFNNAERHQRRLKKVTALED
jgi:RpiB/LacA/LacB family sugar-phosphate isomerase